jgi:acyl-CoA reductase-like NAD-dependent aldehyde dehydrogenase
VLITRDISFQSALATSEVFGPITEVFGFEGDGDGIAQTNDTDLGLAGYVYT